MPGRQQKERLALCLPGEAGEREKGTGIAPEIKKKRRDPRHRQLARVAGSVHHRPQRGGSSFAEIQQDPANLNYDREVFTEGRRRTGLFCRVNLPLMPYTG
ncbi:hypothetical protein DPEC_G00344940 [Dallia pectoralis]|uniref:Uncharacterized protein n=1 Tax=Dallia pectoralis TaxID=75939 RepID=A0ACC2F3I3_DALPE|nr:hypothetical protein DPEC_G00344940 [Dallia pectoralis]